ncbi:MAG: hypothetical protein ACTHOK_20220 [Nocardioidaceae bacterium]
MPGRNDAADAFDAFYRSTRRALLHQTLALTGDLTAAQAAVRDAYVAAWQHWRKVSRLPAPQDWVRPRAWRLAQHKHTGRLWHRNRGVDEEQQGTLDALGKLSSAQRRALLLVQLAALPLPQAARELGVTRDVAEQHLQAATAHLAISLDTDSTSLLVRLEALSAAVAGTVLPRAPIIRRAGRKRRQLHAVAAVVAAAAVSVGSGAFAYAPPDSQAASAPTRQGPRADPIDLPVPEETPAGPKLPTAENLLDSDQISRLGPGRQWSVVRTDDNTSGDGLNTVCQQQRFADPKGLSTLVRTFEAAGHPKRSAVQTVEISRSARRAERTYRTTVGWYAGCQASRLQLLRAFRVDDVGDEAVVMFLRAWQRPVTTYSVAVARSGTVTTSTVGTAVGGTPPPVGQVAQSLADAVSMLCARSGSSSCAQTPTFRPAPPPPAGHDQGFLAVADLPPVGRVDHPWVATDPVSARKNPSATTCDRADFAGAGAEHTVARTYLIPQAKVPARFGLSETYGEFAGSAGAERFLSRVRHRVARCEHRDLSTSVLAAHTVRHHGRDVSVWELRTEVSAHLDVRFRVGFVRVGSRVAQLTFAPAPHDDMTATAFHDLVLRAGDRLHELD